MKDPTLRFWWSMIQLVCWLGFGAIAWGAWQRVGAATDDWLWWLAAALWLAGGAAWFPSRFRRQRRPELPLPVTYPAVSDAERGAPERRQDTHSDRRTPQHLQATTRTDPDEPPTPSR